MIKAPIYLNPLNNLLDSNLPFPTTRTHKNQEPHQESIPLTKNHQSHNQQSAPLQLPHTSQPSLQPQAEPILHATPTTS